MAHTLPIGLVTVAVCEVTVTPPVTAGSPPLWLTLTHTSALITLRPVTLTDARTFQPPVAPVALTPTRKLVTAGAHGSSTVALTGFGAGGRPPALFTGAVPIDWVTVAVPSTLTGELAQRTPAVLVAGALTGGRVTAAVWVARAHLAAI